MHQSRYRKPVSLLLNEVLCAPSRLVIPTLGIYSEVLHGFEVAKIGALRLPSHMQRKIVAVLQ